jgi:hypothetical protein
MKKILSTMAVIVVATQATVAQQTTTFGITAGAVTSYSSFEDDMWQNFDSKIGLTFGILSNIPVSKSLSFQPAIHYVQKGFRVAGEFAYEATKKLNYLELPLNFVYNTQGKNGHFFIGAGPSIAYGIAAKLKMVDSEEKLHFGSEENDVAKPLEIGANILMGYQFANGFNIAANYNSGLNNISVHESTEEHNYYFGLRIGYMFIGKSKKSLL